MERLDRAPLTPDMIMAVAAPCWPEYESSVDAVAPGASVSGGVRVTRRGASGAWLGRGSRCARAFEWRGAAITHPVGDPPIGAGVVRAMQYALGVAGLDSLMRRAKQATDVKSVQSLRSGKDFQSRLLRAYPGKTPVLRRSRLAPSIRSI
jgi:hypothetical protein